LFSRQAINKHSNSLARVASARGLVRNASNVAASSNTSIASAGSSAAAALPRGPSSGNVLLTASEAAARLQVSTVSPVPSPNSTRVGTSSLSPPPTHWNGGSSDGSSPPQPPQPHQNQHQHHNSGGTDALRAGGGHARFDKGDERAMGAFCAEVACALKRRSVEAAFMKVISDANKGTGAHSSGAAAASRSIPDEFNVSLLSLYTDADT
jgi:hypothetical protein